MADVDLVKTEFGNQGDFIAVEFANTNRRIRRVYVDIQQPGTYARAVVWDTDEPGTVVGDASTAIVDRTFTAPSVEEFVVTQNYRVVEVTDEHGTFWDFPPNLVVQFFGGTV